MSLNHKTNVILTIDTEVWIEDEDWHDIDASFPEAFDTYINGKTPNGDYGVPFLLKVLRDYGLQAVFFVEPLFSLRLKSGPELLEEIVSSIQDAGQDVELHLHTEWLDKTKESPLPNPGPSRENMKDYSYDEQRILLETGKELLLRAGADGIRAFRAGNFGANNDTLRALATADIPFDSSYNPALPRRAIATDKIFQQVGELEGIIEVPMTTYIDGMNQQRPASFGACSSAEMESMLRSANQQGWENFVVLTHPIEFLNRRRTGKNSVIARRLIEFCDFIARNNDQFITAGFDSPSLRPYEKSTELLRCNFRPALFRIAEQAWSRL